MQRIYINSYEIDHICSLLELPRVQEFCNQTDFFRNFRTGVQYDIRLTQRITHKQLFQVKKIVHLAGIRWTLNI
jgi:hypothetical protein